MPGGWGVLGVAVAALLALAILWVGARRKAALGRGGLLSTAARPPRSVGACGAGEWDAAWQRACAPARRATEELLRVVRDEIQGGHEDAAVGHWLALVAAGLDAHAEPALAIHAAALLRDRGRSDEAAAALRAALRASGGSTGLAVAARVARAAADLDPHLALDAAWRALGSHELALLDRQDLERLIARLEPGERLRSGEELRAPEAPAVLEPPPAAAPSAQRGPIDLGQRRRLEVALAIPVAIEPGGLRVALEAGVERVVGWREIDAVAVAAVEGLGPSPVLVVDLVGGWRRPAEEPLRIVRLRSDRYDPCKLAPEAGSPMDALRDLVDRLLGETGAAPLPDRRAAKGRPFAGFRDLARFEQEVLGAEDLGPAG